MKKSVTIAGLLLVGLVCTGALGLYIFREAVATAAAKRALAGTPVSLQHLQGLTLNWHSAQIEALSLQVEGATEAIAIRNLQAHFTLTDPGLTRVEIGHLSLPAFSGDTDSGADSSAPLLSDMLRILDTLPLPAVDIDTIDLAQRAVAEQLQWQRGNGGQTLALRRGELLAQVSTAIDDSAADIAGASADIHLRLGKRTLAEASLRLQRSSPESSPRSSPRSSQSNGHYYRATATLQTHSDDWQNTLATLGLPLPMPAQLSDIRGRLKLALRADIPDDLNDLLKQTLTIAVTPDTDIALVYTDKALPAGPLQLQLKASSPADLVFTSQDTVVAEARIPAIDLSLTDMQSETAAAIELRSILCRQHALPACSADIVTALSGAALQLGDIELQSLQAAATAKLSSSGERLSITIAPGQLLHVGRLASGTAALSGLTATATSPLLLSVDGGQGTVSLQGGGLEVDLPDAALDGNRLQSKLILDDIALSRGDDLSFTAQVTAPMLGLDIPGQPLPGFAMRGKIELNGAVLALESWLDSDKGRPLLAIAGRHDLASRAGDATIRSPALSFDQAGNSLSKHFSRWPLPLDIVNGSWRLRSRLAWRQNGDDLMLSGEISSDAEQLAGNYMDYAFVDLNSAVEIGIEAVDRLITTKPAALSIGKLDIGMPVERLRLSASFDTQQQRMELHNFDAEVLGGRISAADIVHQLAAQDTVASLSIDRIELGELVLLAAAEEISASGRVSGELPFTISRDGLRIEQGRLSAIEPGGVLNYRPDAATLQTIAANPTTKFAYDVLNNYHFSTLDTEIQYRPDGWTLLTNRMYGINPDLNSGQAIKLNPRIEINALDTLRSLRVGRTVSDFFEAQLDKP